jgi:hypothetical protein
MRYVVSVTLAAALIVGCGGVPSARSSPGAGAPQEPAQPVIQAPEGTGMAGGVCYLVPDATIEGIMGRPAMGGGSGFELGGQRFCNWILFFDPHEDVGIVVSRAVNFSEETAIWTDKQRVSGLGEDAYWVPSVNGLYVLKGAYSVYISVNSETQDVRSAAIAVAREAVSRLP